MAKLAVRIWDALPHRGNWLRCVQWEYVYGDKADTVWRGWERDTRNFSAGILSYKDYWRNSVGQAASVQGINTSMDMFAAQMPPELEGQVACFCVLRACPTWEYLYIWMKGKDRIIEPLKPSLLKTIPSWFERTSIFLACYKQKQYLCSGATALK